MAQDRALRDFPRPPEWITIADPVDAMVRTMSSVMDSGRIWIYAGPAQPEVYSDPRLLNFIRYSANRGTQFRVATGPILIADEEGQNGLLRLREERAIHIEHRKFFGPTNPLIVVETAAPHPYGLNEENLFGKIRNRARYTNSEWHWWARSAISRVQYESRQEETIPNPFLATPELFIRLINATSEAGSFVNTSINDFLRLPEGSQLRHYQSLKP